MAIDAPVLPIVDGDGTVWFVSARPTEGDAYSVTAADSTGWSATASMDAGGPPAIQPTATTGPDGIVVAAKICVDESCDSTQLVARTFQRSGDVIQPVGDEWRSESTTADAESGPRPVNASSEVGAIQDGARVVLFAAGGDPRVVELPAQGGDPCVTGSGDLVAVQMHTPGEATPGEVTDLGPEAEAGEEVATEIVQSSESGWMPLPESRRAWDTVYANEAAFGCGVDGLYYGLELQPARLAWVEGWVDLEPDVLDWQLSAAAPPPSLVGILDDLLVQVDPVSGDTTRSIALPNAVAAELEERLAAPRDAAGGPVGGWLAVGGASDKPVGVACLGPSGSATDREVDCSVFGA